MSKYKLDNRTLTLLQAQVNLTETFTHLLRSTPRRDVLSFRLKVERSQSDTLFTVELGSERHTLTLPNEKKMHLKLADFIEEIVNGPFDPSNTADLLTLPHASRRFGTFEAEQRQQVFELVRTGGTLSLDMGFDLPIQIALHRNITRKAVTTIMSIGVKKPRTKCFTVFGSDTEMYEKIVESINHLAAVATPAAHAA
ncbi:hypothetical protein [Pseudomonas chlororaphis]|uniref:hypothetical protein n=1 Tax=Pseudomonas chlororaphis TaxID=587753 RepID=UPI000F55F6AA|nr:hypothetical protein [Pseudomonas chlororaphis]AZC49675.1 hypothetical protein C4K35_2082 [Pseudomonas chlororaphis subsp. piscium]MBP5058527.1 hypothetical protein [Pseudomonas chlororaphis]MBP5139255.1 hypothetical protein [Pseudomonas chlororaphis]QTT98670.1 hypothetical protein HUT26_05160 [Pseudomonas chlororaphis]